MVSVYLLETRSVQENQYVVSASISTSSGISSYVFVKRESTYEFDRVATLQDMLSLPEGPTPNYGYYRDMEFVMRFPDVSMAQYFSSGVRDRLDKLVTDYDNAANSFIGSSSDLIQS